MKQALLFIDEKFIECDEVVCSNCKANCSEGLVTHEIEVKDVTMLYPNFMISEALKLKSRDEFQAVLNRRIAELRGRK